MEDKWILSNCCEILVFFFGYLGKVWLLGGNYYNKLYSFEWFGSFLKKIICMWKEIFFNGSSGYNSGMLFFRGVFFEIFFYLLIEGFLVESSIDKGFGFGL